MNNLYYVFAMGSTKREKAQVVTATEAKKHKGFILCGATFYLKKHKYGLLYCHPDNYEQWEQYAKANGGKLIEWERYKDVETLYSPNRKEIARRPAAALKGEGS